MLAFSAVRSVSEHFCTSLGRHPLKLLALMLITPLGWGETYLCGEASSGIDWQYIRSGDGFTDENSDRFEIIFESDNYLQLNLAGALPDRRQAFQTAYIDKTTNFFFLKTLFPAIGQRGWTQLTNQGTCVTIP